MSDAGPLLEWSGFVYDLQRLLRDKGVTTPLYVVGGAVRDAYKRAEITDVDIAVDGDAIGIAKNVADWLDADIYIMDRARGVARVFVKRGPGAILLDFARFRGATLHDDLIKRDFTVNTLAADLLGDLSHLIDMLGGERDLRERVLRRCSRNAIEEDPVRALRAVRQSTQLALKIHPATLSDVRQFAPGLSQISPERIRDEFFKLLALDNAARGLRVLQHLGILQRIFPGQLDLKQATGKAPQHLDAWSRNLRITERMCAILTAVSERRTDNSAAAFDLGMLVIQWDRFRGQLQGRLSRSYGNGRRHKELLVLAALLSNLGELDSSRDGERLALSAKVVSRSLRLTLEEGRYLSLAMSNYHVILDESEWSTLLRHRFWHGLGEAGIDAIFLAAAVYLGRQGAEIRQADWLAFVDTATELLDTWFNQYDDVVSPPPLLDGDDIMKTLGIRRGPRVGQLLSALREAQVLGTVGSVSEAQEFVVRKHVESS
ncbi:MAG: hypothetical protein OXG60_18035 [Chloroflexi bacterium]|nr:hypothetical protein [Chloroflexota bacterium]